MPGRHESVLAASRGDIPLLEDRPSSTGDLCRLFGRGLHLTRRHPCSTSSVPSRSRRTSGPANAFWTVTCWSSANPMSSAIGSDRDQGVGLVGLREVQAFGHAHDRIAPGARFRPRPRAYNVSSAQTRMPLRRSLPQRRAIAATTGSPNPPGNDRVRRAGVRRGLRATLVDHLDHEHVVPEFGSELDLGSGSGSGVQDRIRRQLARDKHCVVEHVRDLMDVLECFAGLPRRRAIARQTDVQEFGARGRHRLGLPDSARLTRISPA